MTPEFYTLHEKAKQLSQKYRHTESELLEVLLEIDTKKAYLALGYSSLYQYCVQALSLTESQSYAFMAVARKSREVPELKEAVKSDEMSLSNARKLVSVITPQNKEIWLEKGKQLPQKALEREIAKSQPEPPVKERIRPVSEKESGAQSWARC